MRRAAGQYDQYVTVQTLVQAANDSGHLVDTPAIYCQRFGHFETTGGSEVETAHQQQARRHLVLYLPYDVVTKNITAQMTVDLDGMTLQIDEVEDVNYAHEEMRLACTQVETVEAA